MIRDWWDRQDESVKVLVSIFGPILSVLLVVGVLSFVYIRAYDDAAARFHRRAVEAGYAHWVLGSDGQPEFKWKELPK